MATLQCSHCGGTRYDTNHRCEKGCGVMTAKDEVQSLRERLEQVRGERDEISRDWDSEHYHRLAVERDRDAMAAHVERIREALEDTRDSVYRALCVIDDAPATSLARRDARVKAEALERLVSEFSDPCVSVGALDVVECAAEAAIKYRQQAEADQ